MFAPRSLSTNSNTTTNNRSRGVVLSQNNNENALHSTAAKSSSKSTSKKMTPSGIRPARRALGDISNKKKSSNGGGKEDNNKGVVVLKQPHHASRLKTPSSKSQQSSLIPRFTPSSTSNKTTSSKVVVSQSLIPKLTSHHRSSIKPPPTRSTKQPQKQRTVDFPVPRTTTQPKPSVVSTTSTTIRDDTIKLQVLDPVDDVEFSAGRTWRQQQEHDDDDDDDFSRTSSMEDTADFNRTMWDDWKSSLRQQAFRDEEDAVVARLQDAQVQAHIETVLNEDHHDEGLECLLDWVEGLDLDDRIASNNYGDPLDDDWSVPASSLQGPDESLLMALNTSVLGADDLDESLLFEL